MCFSMSINKNDTNIIKTSTTPITVYKYMRRSNTIPWVNRVPLCSPIFASMHQKLFGIALNKIYYAKGEDNKVLSQLDYSIIDNEEDETKQTININPGIHSCTTIRSALSYMHAEAGWTLYNTNDLNKKICLVKCQVPSNTQYVKDNSECVSTKLIYREIIDFDVNKIRSNDGYRLDNSHLDNIAKEIEKSMKKV